MEELEVNKVNDLVPGEKDLTTEEALELMQDPSANINKPSDAEVLAAQEEFQSRANKFETQGWEIGPAEEAEANLNYLLHFIENRAYWTKQGWMGLIKMKEEVETIKTAFKEGDSLRLTYQPLVFGYHMLTNPGGVGHTSAVNFENEAKEYGQLLMAMENSFNISQEELKEIQFLQEKWAAYSQGFYYEKDEPIDEDEVDGMIKDNLEALENDPDELPDVTDHLEEEYDTRAEHPIIGGDNPSNEEEVRDIE